MPYNKSMEQAITNIMGALGRGGDATMAHVTPGDVVIPRDVVLDNPEFLTKLKKAMADMGGDYRSHIVGSGYENVNPETGAPEFFFKGLKSFFSNPIKSVGNFVSNIIENPIPAIGGALIGGPILGTSLAGLTGLMGGSSGSGQQSAAPPQSNLGEVEQEFVPKRPDESPKPFGLFSSEVGGQQFSTLDPTQQRSYLATQGTYGSGLGNEDKNYYLNLLQRNLIDDSGQLGNINEALLPVERNYLSRIGLPTGDTKSFFQALQGAPM